MLPDGVFREGTVFSEPPLYMLPVEHIGFQEQDGPIHSKRITRVYPKQVSIGKVSSFFKANTKEIANQALYSELKQQGVYSVLIVNMVLWPSENIFRWGTCNVEGP